MDIIILDYGPLLGCFTTQQEIQRIKSNVIQLWRSHLAFALLKHHFEAVQRQGWFLHRGSWREWIGCSFDFFLLFCPLLLFILHVCLCFRRSLMGRWLLAQAGLSHGFAGGSRWFWGTAGFAGGRLSRTDHWCHAQLRSSFLLRRLFPAFLQHTQVS